jgi:hypothetical protein
MKLTSFASLAAVILTGGVFRALALAGDLDRPSLGFPESIAPGVRERIMQVLSEEPSEFQGGEFVNARTTLRYVGGGPSLNRFLAGLAACPDLQLRIAFRKHPGEVAWTLEHDGWTAPQRFSNLVNLDCKALRLDEVLIPEIRTSVATATPGRDAALRTSAGPGAAAQAERSFGPVIERVVPFGVPCAAKYFQFHTGDVFEIGDGPGDTSDHAEEWRRINASGGVDALAIGGEDSIQFAGEGCLFTRDPAPDWDTLTAEETVQRLRFARWITGVIEAKRQELPLTFLFKTARGDRGVLQIRSITRDSRGSNGLGMLIRYKLVSPVPD